MSRDKILHKGFYTIRNERAKFFNILYKLKLSKCSFIFVESLETTLKTVTYDDKHIKLYRKLSKK